MLERVLEPEVMDDYEEARAYNAMDHSSVNRRFAEDLLSIEPLGLDCLDVGTGTAWIPVELCEMNREIRIMATDASEWMLELARYNIEVYQCVMRVQLHLGDAKKMVFQNDYFDTVFSNSLVHHLPVHDGFFRECVRVLRPGGVLFIRDLLRPESMEEVAGLVDLYGGADDHGRQMLRQSLIAALTLPEIRTLVASLGIPPESIQQTSDRHWTLAARASHSKEAFEAIILPSEKG